MPRVLITAGPTHEAIDSVRYIGNRSSGRMGVCLADAASARGWQTHLLLGPSALVPREPRVRLTRFVSCEDLRALLARCVPEADVLIMAAAVADYRPLPNPAMSGGKFRRTGEKFLLELEPTPDLLAEVGRSRRADQYMVGFALEPREELLESARRKLVRKRVDMVVANPLEAMDAPSSEVTLVYADDRVPLALGTHPKERIAGLVLDALASELAAGARRGA